MKKPIQIINFFLLGTFCLLVITGVYLSSKAGEKQIRQIAEKQLTNWLELPVRIGVLETNLFSRLQVENVQVYQSNDQPILYLGKGSIHYNLFKLLKKSLDIKYLRLDSLNLFIARDSTGHFTFDYLNTLLKPDSVASQFTVSLGRFRIERSTFQYHDQSISLDAALTQTFIDLQEIPDSTLRIEFRARQSDLTIAQKSLYFNNIRLGANIKNGQITVEEFKTVSAEMLLSGTITARFPDLDASLNIQGNPQTFLKKSLPALYATLAPFDGEVDLNIRASGSLPAPDIEVCSQIRHLTISGAKLIDGFFNVSYHSDSLILRQFTAKTDGGSITAKAYLINDDLWRHSAALSITNLDIQPVWAAIFPDPILQSGRLNATIFTHGALKNALALTSSGDIRLSNLSMREQPVPDIVATVQLREGQFSTVFYNSLNGGNITADLTNGQLNARFSFILNDIEPLAQLVNIAAFSGRVNLTGSVTGAYKNPKINTSISVSGLSYQYFPVEELSADISYFNKELIINHSWFHGKILHIHPATAPFGLNQLRGTYEYRGQLLGTIPALRGTLQIEMAYPGYSDYQFDSGQLSIEFQNDRWWLRDFLLIKSYGQICGNAEFTLSNRQANAILRLQTIDLKEPGFGIISGNANLKNMDDLNIKVDGLEIDLNRLHSFLPAFPEMDGILNFKLALLKNIKQPEICFKPDIHGFKYRHLRYDTITAEIGFRNSQLTLNPLQLIKPGEKLHLTANIPILHENRHFTIDHTAAASGSLLATNINLSQFNSLIPADIIIDGISQLNIVLSGSVGNPVLNGSMSLENGYVHLAGNQNPINDLMLKINLNHDKVQLEYLSGIYTNIPFLIRLTATTRHWKQFSGSGHLSIRAKEIFTIRGNFDHKTTDLNGRFKNIDLADFANLLPDVYALQGFASGTFALSGPWQRPEINANLNIEDGLFRSASNSPPLTNIAANISLQKSRLDLKNLSGSINDLPFNSGGHLTLIGKNEFTGSWQFNIREQETLKAAINSKNEQFTATLKMDQFDLALLQSFTPKEMITKGSLSSKVSLTGSYAKPHIHGFINLSDGFFRLSDSSPPIEKLQMATIIQDTLLYFRHFTGLIQKAPFFFTGHLRRSGWHKFQVLSTFNLANQKVVDIDGLVGRDTLEIRLTVDSLDLSIVQLFTKSVSNIQGHLISCLTVSGFPEQPHITGNLNIRNASIETDTSIPRFENLQLTTTFQDSPLIRHSLDALVGGIPIHTRGEVYTRRFEEFLLNLNIALYHTDIAKSELSISKTAVDGYTEISNLNLAELQPFFKNFDRIGGILNARLNISGILTAPQLSATAAISGGLFQMQDSPYPVKSVEASIAAENSYLQIDSLSALFHEFPVQISGQVNQTEPHHYQLKFVMRSHAKKTLDIGGTILPKYADLILEMSDLNLSLLMPFIPIQHLDGKLNSKIQITGSRIKPLINGSLVLKNGSVQTDFLQQPVENINIDGQITDNKIRLIELSARYRSNEFDLNGSLEMAERRSNVSNLVFYINKQKTGTLAGFYNPTRIDAQLNIENLDIGIFKDFIPDIHRLSGTMNSSATIRGAPDQPKIDGEIILKNGSFQLNSEIPAVRTFSMNVVLQDSAIRFEECRGMIQDATLNLKGSVVSRDWKSLSSDLILIVNNDPTVSIKGEVSADAIHMNLLIKHLNLNYFQPFTTQFRQLNGDINSFFQIGGSPENPVLNGRARLSDICFQPTPINETFTDGLLSLRFEQTRFIMDTLSIKLNKGTISGDGYFTYREKDIDDVNIRTSLKNITLSMKKQYLVSIKSSNLHLYRENKYYNLDGDVVFSESKIQYNLQPKMLIDMARNTRRPTAEPSKLQQKIRLNIRVRDSKKIWIDNNLARVRLHPELAVIGTAAKSNISGRLTFEEGYILYLDRKFKVQRGIIDFVDPNNINPIIDFIAESEIKSYQTLSKKAYKITITITGPLDEVVFDLQSQPPLEKSDIIALMTLGATREDLVGQGLEPGSGGVATAIQERLTEYSSQRLSSYTSRKAGTLLGLDEMSIEGNLFSFGKSWGPQLIASKQISERMSVSYSTSVGHLNDQNVKLEYKLSNEFSLEGQTDQRGHGGLDLKYKLKFK